jgi:sterol desaturase/sphingolipid hydroxylase (fatty acid hydroxylase superfamily)
MMDLLRGFQALQLPPFVVQSVELCGWLLFFLVVFVPVERMFAVRRQKILRGAFWHDLGYYFLSGLLPKFLLAVPISIVAWTAHHYVPYRLHLAVESLPGWARIAASVIVLEIGFYWGHRWSHTVPFLWRFHAVHHSAEEIDWLINTRAHPFDLAFTRLCGYAPLYILGLVGSVASATPFALVVIGVGWGFFIHSNLKWRFGWLEWLVSTPAFHHWHHTNDQNRDKNFAPLFPVIDWMFGTLYLPKRAWPTEYGIDAPISPGMFGQLIDPILPAMERAPRPVSAAPHQ